MAWQHREFDSPTVHQFGVWRSPVAHLHGVQGAAGSNPATPTKQFSNALVVEWQTQQLEGLPPRGVKVQILSRVPTMVSIV